MKSLYQTYRPESFADVVGQEHVVEALKAGVKNGPAHAYVFAGGRGTGKTSLARIFARSLGTAEVDIMEMDAASRTGVDDIRELTDSVPMSPFQSQFKIYILDEAHMLSKSAFNALLKTLEEPPAHVIFILATTDPDRLPDTVLSRCLVFQFETPSASAISKVLDRTAKAEKIKLAADARDLLALMARGSHRDALSLLEQVARVAEGDPVDVELVTRITGAPRHEQVVGVLAALEHQDQGRLITIIRELEAEATNPDLFLSLLIDSVRLVLRLRFGGVDAGSEKDSRSEHIQVEAERMAKKAPHLNSSLLETLLNISKDLAWSPLPYALVEARLGVYIEGIAAGSATGAKNK